MVSLSDIYSGKSENKGSQLIKTAFWAASFVLSITLKEYCIISESFADADCINGGRLLIVKAKLITSLTFLLILGYYGSSFGLLLRAMGIWIGFISGSFPAMINSVFQFTVIIYIIWTALVKPHCKSERTLFIISFIVLGFNAMTNILALRKSPKKVITYSIITIFFYISLFLWCRAFKQNLNE